MAFEYVSFEYPNTNLIQKIIAWINGDCHCYFALKLEYDDDWTYFAGNTSHALSTGRKLTGYGIIEADAQTNYLTTTRDSNGKILCVLPLNFQAKYIRMYIETGYGIQIYEFRPSTYFAAHEIITGTLEITDALTESPIITVSKSGIDRIKIGNFESTYYGLAGYDFASNKIFELSDNAQKIAGWSFDKDKLYTASLEIDGANNIIKTSDYISGPLGKGWKIDATEAVFQNIIARGKISCSVFEKNTLSAVNGFLMIGNADTLASDMTALDSSTMIVSGNTSFAVGEIVRMKTGVDDEWLEITNIASAPTYTVTRDLVGSYLADSAPAWKAGTAVVSTGLTGKGFITLDASSIVSPIISIYQRNSALWSDYSEIVRIGNLNEFLGYTTDTFGLAMGTGSQFIKADPINGIRITADITASNISGSLITGSTLKTAASGQRVEITSDGIALIMLDTNPKYSTFKYADGTKYGSGIRAWIHNKEKHVPFYCLSENDYADFHFVNRASDPTGAAEVGDCCMSESILKLCTSPGTPGTWDPVGAQATAFGQTIINCVNVSALWTLLGDATPPAIGETTPNTIRALNKEIIMAATDTLDANECAGTLVNNYGQTDDTTITLPACAAGMSFVVVLGTTVAKYFRLDPNASDSIYLNGVTTGNGKYVGIASAVLGATISFIAFKIGASSYAWFASSISGLWVAEA